MLALLRKEFRSRIPFLLLILFFTLVSYGAQALTEPLSLTSTEKLYGDGLIELGMEYAITVFVLSLALSYGLLVREFDDRTIEFLDALPVSRTQLFFAKWFSAFCTLAFVPIVDIFFVLGIRALSTTSLDRSYHFDWIMTSLGLQLVQMYCFLSIGLVLSFLRRFGWLALGLFGWSMMIAGRFIPELDLSNLVLCGDPQFFGKRWLVPWQLVFGYLAVGSLALLMAYGLFLGGGRVLLRWLAGSESRAKQVVLVGCSAAIVFVVLGIMTQTILEEPPESPDAVRVTYPGWATTSRSTETYDVVFPNNLANRANRLLDEADGVYASVAEFFDFEEDLRISVDMTSFSGHHLGTAYWNKLKLNLTSHEDLPSLRQTLGHETTHVILESLSDNQLRENFGSVRFFHEGVATYVERRFFMDEELTELRLNAALLQDRGDASFDRLVDNDRLRAEHDSFLAYELGEVFAAAIVRRFGDEAIGNLARTFADRRHSEGLSGVLLWRSIFQASGYSLNEAVDEYYELLEETQQIHADTVAQLPELRPIVELEDAVIWVGTEQVPPDGWEIVVRFRSSTNATDDQYWVVKLVDGYGYAMLDSFVGRAAWYQIGYRQRNKMPIYQPWKKVRIP
ncbi:MAG: ABC transporter permease [Planctomycetota bacterium]